MLDYEVTHKDEKNRRYAHIDASTSYISLPIVKSTSSMLYEDAPTFPEPGETVLLSRSASGYRGGSGHHSIERRIVESVDWRPRRAVAIITWVT
jgi:hypothetical protein